jgi:hypothetical protein
MFSIFASPSVRRRSRRPPSGRRGGRCSRPRSASPRWSQARAQRSGRGAASTRRERRRERRAPRRKRRRYDAG